MTARQKRPLTSAASGRRQFLRNQALPAPLVAMPTSNGVRRPALTSPASEARIREGSVSETTRTVAPQARASSARTPR